MRRSLPELKERSSPVSKISKIKFFVSKLEKSHPVPKIEKKCYLCIRISYLKKVKNSTFSLKINEILLLVYKLVKFCFQFLKLQKQCWLCYYYK